MRLWSFAVGTMVSRPCGPISDTMTNVSFGRSAAKARSAGTAAEVANSPAVKVRRVNSMGDAPCWAKSRVGSQAELGHQLRPDVSPWAGPLVGTRGCEDGLVCKMPTDDMQADRQSVRGEARGNACRWLSREVANEGEA